MKKKKVVFIIICAVIITALVSAAIMIMSRNNKDNKLSVASQLTEVIDINELSTGEFIYNGVVEVQEEKTKYSIRYCSTVKVGVAGDDIELSVDAENKTVTPIIPELKVTVVNVDPESLSFVPENVSVKLKNAVKLCEEDAVKEANNKPELLETAESNLKSTIEALLMPIVNNNDYTVVWEPAVKEENK